MVVPNTIEVPSQSASGPDIYAATLVVNGTGANANFTTLEAALAALIAASGGAGGKIFLREGPLTPPVGGYILPACPVEIEGAGSGWDNPGATTIDATAFGPGSVFVSASKHKRKFLNFNVLGDGAVGQHFYENQQGSGEYSDFENIRVKDMQGCFAHTQPWSIRLFQFEHAPALGTAATFWHFLGGAGGNSYIWADQTRVIGATIDDNPFLYATNSEFTLTQAAGPVVNNITQLRVAACQFAGEILVAGGGSTIADTTFTNGIFGVPPPRYLDFPAGLSTITGCIFNVDASVEDIRVSGGSAQAQIVGCSFASFAGGVRSLNLTVPSGANIANCDFHGGSSEQILINTTSIDVTITGCNFTDDGTAPRAIDIAVAAFRIAIVGNNFKFFDTEAIRIAGARCTVVGNTGCKVVETAAANLNIYSANGGFSGSTISVIGNASLVEDNNVVDVGVDIVVADYNRTILVNASGGNRTVTLFAAATDKWRKLTIKKTDATANTVTIAAAGAETIDGSPTFVLTVQNQSIEIQTDGTTWWII